MAAEYPVLLRQVVVDSTNKTIIFNDGTADRTATLAEGTYYLRGNSGDDDLVKIIQTAFAGAPSSTLGSEACSLSIDIDKDNAAAVFTFSADAAWTLKDDGTFDLTLLGFDSTLLAADIASSGNAVASTLSPKILWCADQPYETREEDPIRPGARVLKSPSGNVFVFNNSDVAPNPPRDLTLQYLGGKRAKRQRNADDPYATFEGFWEGVSDGTHFELLVEEVSSGTTLTALTYAARLGTYVLGEQDLQRCGVTLQTLSLARYRMEVRLEGVDDSAATGEPGGGGGGGAYAGGNQSHASLQAFMEDMSGSDAATPTAGGTLTINGQSLGSYDYTIKSGNTTISSFTNGDWFTVTEDSRVAAICVDGNLTIDAGQTLIPTNRKLLTVLYVDGNLTVNGGISMSARGADHSSATGSNVAAAAVAIDTGGTYSIPAAGGAGATAPAAGMDGTAGTAGSSGGTGGGGSGSGAGNPGGNGAAGTAFGGGPAGAGQSASSDAGASLDGAADGGPGGAANCENDLADRAAGGGAGNPGGAGDDEGGSASGSAGDSGTGGALVVFVTGTYSGSGTVTAAGADGGGADGASTAGAPRGGGGTGGGHAGVYILTGGSDGGGPTPTADGGAAGQATNGTVTNYDGGPGGAGTAQVQTGV